ncbi:hypothetical protein EBZ37_07305, partial [bacterium]|nr:hypothetical protein [bacterium]
MRTPDYSEGLKISEGSAQRRAFTGKTAEDLSIESREVEIMSLTFIPQNNVGETLPCFGMDVEE